MRRLPQFDANVLLLYARAIPAREVQAHRKPLKQAEVSSSDIRAVGAEVMAEVTARQSRVEGRHAVSGASLASDARITDT